MKRLNKAFTLTELLIALGVIAILCAILLPVIFNLMPNQNTIMAKRAYYTLQSVVADLINDEGCYPDKTAASDEAEKRIGFDDGAGFPNCNKWQNINSTDAKGKFLTLFSDKLGISKPNEGSVFTTNDGIDWIISNMAFASTGDGGSALITVDVNGKGAPNCGQGTTYSGFSVNGSDCSTRTSGFDRFQMRLYGNGRIEFVGSTWAQNAVKVDRNITGDGTSNDNDN